MKRFIYSVLCVSVFCVGLGAVADRAGATFKSDEKALELIRKARQAIGGDAAISNVQSMRIVGRTTHVIKMNGVDKSESGETEIAFQFPDKMTRTVRMGSDSASGERHKVINRDVDVMVLGDKQATFDVRLDAHADGTVKKDFKIVIKKDDGTTQELTGDEAAKFVAQHPLPEGGERKVFIKKADGTTEVTGEGAHKVIVRDGKEHPSSWKSADGKTIIVDDKKHVVRAIAGAEGHSSARHNQMLQTTLALLLTAPAGIDVAYTYGGEGSVDGTACNIVNASFGGQTFKLFLDGSSNLPVAINFSGPQRIRVMHLDKERAKHEAADGTKDIMIMRTPGKAAGESAEYQVKFSDYRSVNGVQLPYRWTQTIGGKADETFEVTNYDVNPANITDSFKNQKVMVRSKN